MNPMLIVTLMSIAVAASASAVAWKVVHEERRRSNARVAALSAAIHRTGIEVAPIAHGGTETIGNVLAEFHAEGANRRVPLALGIGAFVFGIVAALGYAATSRVRSTSEVVTGASSIPTEQARTRSRAPLGASSLELVALTHEREDNRLIVRGVVKNPAEGEEMRRLSVVVLLFNAEGGFLTSGRGEVNSGTLDSGAEVPFMVNIPGAGNVARYRVSFRSGDRVVPHVDRRG